MVGREMAGYRTMEKARKAITHVVVLVGREVVKDWRTC